MLKKAVLALSTFLPSMLRVPLLRLLGFRIGKHVHIGMMAILLPTHMKIGDYAEIKYFTIISVDRLEMGPYTIIASLSVIFGDGALIMASCSRVGHANLLDCSADIYLGKHCGLGPRNTLYTHSSWLPVTLGYPNNRLSIHLGNYIWTGMNNVILPGTKVNDHVMTYPNMVLSKEITGQTFLTPTRNLPIEKIRKAVDPDKVVRQMGEALAMEVSVYRPTENSTATNEPFDLVLLYKLDMEQINTAKRDKKQVVVFFAQHSKVLAEHEELDRLDVDWYDFETLTMSCLPHPSKIGIMQVLNAKGGLRFLEHGTSWSDELSEKD